MSTPMVILLVVLAAAGLFALAWWASGRSRGTVSASPTTRERDEAKAMKQHRPSTGAPGGGL